MQSRLTFDLQGGAGQQARAALSPMKTGSFGGDGKRELYRLRFSMAGCPARTRSASASAFAITSSWIAP